MRQQLLVDGESVDVLIQILPYLDSHIEARNTPGATAREVPRAVIVPVLRALMRREARLLAEDADKVGDEALEQRTPAQRRSDAALGLLTTLEAMERYQHSISMKT